MILVFLFLTYFTLYNRHRHREQTFRYGGGGEEGKGGMHGETNMKIHITLCKIGSQWEFTV